MPPTILDVAELAGCSKSTVSRYLTGSIRLAGDTRQRIADAIAALGYRPSAIGRSLQGKSPTIGVLVPSLTNPIFASSLAGVQDRARSADLGVIVTTSDYDCVTELAAVRTLAAHRVGGLVLTVCDARDSRALDLARSERIPTVLLFNESHEPGLPSLSVDNAGAARDMARAMVALGHRRIAFVAGHFAASDRSRLRYAGYVDAIRQSGGTPLPPIEVDFLGEAAQERMVALFAAPDAPSALLCSTDILALSAIAALREIGLRVPEDVSVAGFDGLDVGSLVSPRLATVMQPTYEMGRQAMDLLLSRAAGAGGDPFSRAAAARAAPRRHPRQRSRTPPAPGAHDIIGGDEMTRFLGTLGAALIAALMFAAPARAADAICYNCPAQWADWAGMLKSVKTDLGLDVPIDNKNSGQALSQVIAEKANPVADFVYLGATFGIQAKKLGVTEPYKPKSFDQVPAGLKDPDGYWTAIHSGTFGLFVNKDALGGKPVPACWKDLLKPDYDGMVAYLDPPSAFVGYVGAVAINLANGGLAGQLRSRDQLLQATPEEQPDCA